MRYEMRENEYGYQFYDNVNGVLIETDEDLIDAMNSQAQQIEILKIMLRAEEMKCIEVERVYRDFLANMDREARR